MKNTGHLNLLVFGGKFPPLRALKKKTLYTRQIEITSRTAALLSMTALINASDPAHDFSVKLSLFMCIAIAAACLHNVLHFLVILSC